MLSQRASQFRAIQRRLLTRFKDKTPAPLQNLDTLLEGTYRQLLHLAETIQENDLQLEVASNALACATNLFNFILKLWTNMSEEEFSVLQASVTPLVVDTLEAVSNVSNLFILIYLRLIVRGNPRVLSQIWVSSFFASVSWFSSLTMTLMVKGQYCSLFPPPLFVCLVLKL